MIHPDAFSQQSHLRALSEQIHSLSAKLGPTKLMHLCGSHEHALNEYGLRQLLPASVKVIPGPGCPVCVCPAGAIDQAIALSLQPNTSLLSFGDMLRVPGSKESLQQASKRGGSIKMLYSPFDALQLAKSNPDQTFVFFAVGFETTMAGVASLVLQKLPENLYFLMAGRYMPPVLRLLMEIHDESIQGFLLPGHACIITGTEPYDFMSKEFHLPCAVGGFEPADVLLAILRLLESIDQHNSNLSNAYTRAVQPKGNQHALGQMEKAFVLKSGVWRGIDNIEHSAFELKPEFAQHDAKQALNPDPGFAPAGHPPGCQCHRIMLGEMVPTDCGHFKKGCTTQSPIGPCMVSPEGTCASWARFGIEHL